MSKPLRSCCHCLYALLIGWVWMACSWAQSVPSTEWVPVVVLRSEAPVPLRPGDQEGEVVLGFVRASDLEDGLPLDIGWYRVQEPVNAIVSPVQGRQFSLVDHTRVRVQGAARSTGAQGCVPGLARADGSPCEAGVGPASTSVDLETGYRVGNTWWTLGLGQSRVEADTTALLDELGRAGVLPGRIYGQDRLHLGGELHTRYGTFDLGLHLARSELAPLFGQSLQQGRFSISWLHGNLGGGLNTRVQRLDGSPDYWGGIDLGLIWRTPWRGLLTVGARNLVTSGRPPPALDPEAAALDDRDERIPYVRYEQDF